MPFNIGCEQRTKGERLLRYERATTIVRESVFSFFLADLDSVGRRCATGLHKLGARYAVQLRTNADDNGRIG